MPRSWQYRMAGIVLLLSAVPAPAQFRRVFGFGGGNSVGPGGQINLPYIVNDSAGDNWFIDNQGSIRQQNGQPIFAQGAMLTVDNNNFSANNNTATVDPKTGDILLQSPQVGSVGVTRHIFVDKEQNLVRYVDVFHNGGAQDVTINAQIQSSFNYGIQSSSIVPDPKQKNASIGWVGLTPFGRAATEMYAGKGSKNIPQISSQQGQNVVSASWTIKISAGKDAAIMHLHLLSASVDAGTNFLVNLKEAALLHGLTPDLRKIIVNFAAGQNWIGDVEILRGDIFDIVELRGGDQLHGTLSETDYKLDTFYGTVDLPIARVIAMINLGQFRTRQLMVLSDGEIFGGRLEKDNIDVVLASGQTVQIPLDQITRMGYRKQPDEPSEWALDQPMVIMRTGDRVDVQMPASPIAVNTRYGLLNLPPAQIASIIFQPDQGGVHQVLMTDGSQIAGIVTAPSLELILTGTTANQTVTFPTDGMLRLQLAAKVADPDDSTPMMDLVNGDILCGSLSGPLKLDTSFDTLSIDAAQIRAIERSADTGNMRITLGDGTVATGQLRDQSITCHLLSGTDLNVPISLITDYDQPEPQPSAQTVAEIKLAVAQLSADDWHQRDQAQATLTGLGPAVISVLKEMRDQQPDEAKQRIDAILKSISESAHPPSAGTPAPAANPDQ